MYMGLVICLCLFQVPIVKMLAPLCFCAKYIVPVQLRRNPQNWAHWRRVQGEIIAHAQPSLWQKKSFSITTTCCRALYDHLSFFSVLSAKHSSCGRHCDESSFMCTVCVSTVSRINYRLSKCSVLIIAADIFNFTWITNWLFYTANLYKEEDLK